MTSSARAREVDAEEAAEQAEEATPWAFDYDVRPSMPALAWVAAITPGLVSVLCGNGVRRDDLGFFEGTWAGESDVAAAGRSTTTFGSGIVADGESVVIVPPAHTLEPVYLAQIGEARLLVSNSFVALLSAAGLELDPNVLYPRIFGQIMRGMRGATFEVPTTTSPITVHHYENIAIARDGSRTIRPKPREARFESFEDYRDRLTAITRSAFANAPGYVPKVALSRGYDSTASAVLARDAGCRQSVTFRTGWPWRGFTGEEDSGEATARVLGMTTETFERLAYQELDDAPDAEFLATGMTGEDVVYRSMETELTDTVLVTGFWGGAAWRGRDRPELVRIDVSGASLGEFRLRNNFIHVPVPFIGGLQQPSLSKLRVAPEMRPYSVGGPYDEPVPRRMAEEAGVPRAAFGQQKLATSQKIHVLNLDALSPSGRASFEAFCGGAMAPLRKRGQISRADRLILRLAKPLHAGRIVAGAKQRKMDAVMLEPDLGSQMLRWAVSRVAPRYDDTRDWAAHSLSG